MAIQRTPRLLAYALLAGFVFPSVAQGEWVLDGVPVCTAPNVQYTPGIIPDGLGGALIFWVDGRRSQPDLYAQRVTTDGKIAPGWPVNGVFLSGAIGDLAPPVGIPDGTGGAIVVWEDNREIQTSLHNIYAQRITGNGTIAPGWPLDGFPVCTAPDDQRRPQLIPDGTSGAIIVWDDNRDDLGGALPRPDIYALRVTAAGEIARGWPVDGLPICTTPETQGTPSLASDGTGGAIISWVDGRNSATSGGDLYAQRVTASGEIASGWITDGIPVITAPRNQNNPMLIADAQGGALVIWVDARTDPDFDVYAQRITGDGVIAPGWPAEGVPLATGPGYQFFLSVAPDGFGGGLATWYDSRNYGISAGDVYAQRVTAGGGIAPGWPAQGVPVCAALSFQLNPVLAPDGLGGAFVAWQDSRNGLTDIYAQHVTASGEITPGWAVDGLPVCTAMNSQAAPAIATDERGGAIVAWDDARNGGTNLDIFALKLGLDGPVPTLLSLVDVESGSGDVVLTWYGSGAASLPATVQRRTQSTQWQALGAPMSEGPDLLRYEDRSIVPGTRYAYRLAYRDETGEQFTAETWVEIPALTLSLAGFRPNPAIGTATVVFSLPDSRPAQLDVIDVKGRVVHSREVGSLGSGSHVLPLAGETPLGAGMYWIRLTHPERTLMTKGLIVR